MNILNGNKDNIKDHNVDKGENNLGNNLHINFHINNTEYDLIDNKSYKPNNNNSLIKHFKPESIGNNFIHLQDLLLTDNYNKYIKYNDTNNLNTDYIDNFTEQNDNNFFNVENNKSKTISNQTNQKYTKNKQNNSTNNKQSINMINNFHIRSKTQNQFEIVKLSDIKRYNQNKHKRKIDSNGNINTNLFKDYALYLKQKFDNNTQKLVDIQQEKSKACNNFLFGRMDLVYDRIKNLNVKLIESKINL